MSAPALTRVIVLAATAACAAPQAGSGVVTDRETIAGRALANGRIVLLTSEPALVAIDVEKQTFERRPIRRGQNKATLWGLGESDGVLYSIAGFSDLVRVDTDGAIRHSARFQRAMGNLLDLPGGMAAQVAVDNPGAPLLWASDASARLSALAGLSRITLGLSRPEEGVLQLLSCSVPPRVVCWMPGSNELLTIEGRQIVTAARLDAIDRIPPERLLENPALRAIQDALATDRPSFIVLHRPRGDGEQTSLDEFGSNGQLLRRLSAQPLRLLLGIRGGAIIAIAKSGRLVEVPL